ncbi:ABC transporter substrate-binding protein [Paenalcaligenes hominis]|uniref:ABC transporter substrate-binding protein n=1 Tax=Paenalcaligenes hominis TaxID=643674 RepID=UPI0035247AB1
MKVKKLSLALTAILASMSFGAQAQVKIGTVASSTGVVSAIGIPQRNTAMMLPTQIGDLTVEYIHLDDASEPNNTVTSVRKLLSEEKVDAIIGPSGAPHALALIDIVSEAQTPLIAPVGSISVVLPMDEKRKWVFKPTQNDGLVADKLFEHMKANGVKTLAFIGTADAYGETWFNVMSERLEPWGISLVANERFNRPDTSATGQVLKMTSAKPDAVLIAAPGGPAVMPQIGLKDRGYEGIIYQTHGAALNDFIRLGGKAVEDTILGGSLMLVPDQISDDNPSKAIALNYMNAYKERYGSMPATFGGNIYDAWILLEAAIPVAAQSAKPGTVEFRQALRDALEGIKELPGTQGIYNMTPDDHSGFDERGVELLTIKQGEWQRVQ